ncbi:MAG: ABC transporter ATP-binding protein [Oscillospiraceae bacterium]|jgi:putative ABC transport system ATP-binding protein|nr:ABC transporter ATP-binding protein [Oscillospiraceae bacterium]
MAHFIELTNVSKIYKSGEVETPALRDVNFFTDKGEFCVVVGQSGAGKTTLLNLLGGMDTASGGIISVDGDIVSDYSQKRLTSYRRFDIGFVFQFYNLVPNLTALENVELASEICKNPLNAAETLEKVGLKDRMNHFPAQLSGGEQQRVSIARALAKNPKLLLCDEPTGALDDETGKQILRLLRDYSGSDGMTVMLITHNAAITQMAARVVKMRNGGIRSVTINDNPVSPEEIEW